jgi:TolB-like protein/DNA-binding winged helix-turn-helix (wHTH) protein/Flp pilus assembly protein TadD
MSADSGTEVFAFSGFSLNARQRLLFGPDGRSRPLSGRAFDTLLYLVEHPNQLIDKHALMKAVWPTVVVEENNLNQNISIVRRVLGENPREHRFIATVPGRGYRFVAEVTPGGVAPVSAQRLEPANVGIRTGLLRSGMAILAFTNLTGDPEKEYFCDGISEELIYTLTRVRGLKVPSRTSSFAYKGRNVDVRQIARDLGVDTVLEGNVRGAGERVRVSVQLVDGKTGFHFWSQSFERQFEDLFKLQDELTVAIVEALWTPVGGWPDAPTHVPPTRDLEAYQLYLRAAHLYGPPTTRNALHALELLRVAIARDPRFTRAIVLSAGIRIHFVHYDIAPAEHLRRCEHEVRSALSIDADNVSARSLLAMLLALRGDKVRAEEEFRTALSLNEYDPTARLFHALGVCGPTGHLSKARMELMECCSVAPAWAVGAMNLALVYSLLGADSEARRCGNLAIEFGAPNNSPTMLDLNARLAWRAGRYADAARCMNEGLSPPVQAAGGAEAVALVCAALEDRSKVAAATARLGALIRGMQASDLDQNTRRRLLCWYGMLGALDSAFEFANATLDHFARVGTVPTGWAMLWMPEMASFRLDPRFQALASRLGLTEYWARYGPPDGWEFSAERLATQRHRGLGCTQEGSGSE